MKILITQDCAVPSLDGPQHVPANTLQDFEADVVRALVHAGRGLYVDPKDDPSKVKVNTAPEARVEALRKALKAAAKE
jgi:hypothetical protein